MDKNRSQLYLPCEQQEPISDMCLKQLLIITTGDSRRVQLKNDYPNYIHASFVDV